MRKLIVAANWKMNGDAALVRSMTEALKEIEPANVEVVVCPPNILISHFQQPTDFKLGAQNVSEQPSGAYTGETSVAMLKDANCEFVILGHSERRQYQGESNALVAEKFERAIAGNLRPIFCIGEPLEVREQGNLFEYIRTQLMAVIDRVGIQAFAKAVIAYEPIWAIGTGVTATKQQAQEVHHFIRKTLAELDEEIAEQCPILYGGSVTAENAEELFSQQDVDGGLVGGASLKPDSFLAICNVAAG